MQPTDAAGLQPSQPVLSVLVCNLICCECTCNYPAHCRPNYCFFAAAAFRPVVRVSKPEELLGQEVEQHCGQHHTLPGVRTHHGR